jgi:hypothetical protein
MRKVIERDTLEIMQALLQGALQEIAGTVNALARRGAVAQDRSHKLARLWGFDSFLKPKLVDFALWLENSNERTNYTYDLTADNRNQLAGFVDAITGCGIRRSFTFFDELLQDAELRQHVERQVDAAGARGSEEGAYLDRNSGFGRRLGWYAIIRAMRPRLVVETGVDQGLGSVIIASALLRNRAEGAPGTYLGTDINPAAGVLFKPPYDGCGRIAYGDSIETLQRLDQPIDLFINDSDHSAQYEGREYASVAGKLGPDAIVLGDNAHITSELFKFSLDTRRQFLFFAERPMDHFYPGAGIGAAFHRPPAADRTA